MFCVLHVPIDIALDDLVALHQYFLDCSALDKVQEKFIPVDKVVVLIFVIIFCGTVMCQGQTP